MPRTQSAPFPEAASPRRAAVAILVGASLYGGAIGCWHGARLALFAAIKLPLLVFATAVISAPAHSLLCRWLAVPRSDSSLSIALRALARASLLLGALSPIVALFSRSSPPSSTAATTTHNALYLTHTLSVALAGVAGVTSLRRDFSRRAATRGHGRRATLTWIVLFALVGGELAWALRPFVGSVYDEVRFLRRDALDGNVYEFLWTDVLPHLSNRLFGAEE